MSVNEKLGIEIKVDIGNVEQQLAKLGGMLNRTFQVDGLAKLVSELNKMEGASDKITAGFKATANQLDLLKNYWGLASREEAKAHLATMSNMEQVQKIIAKDLEQKKKALTEGNAAQAKAAEIELATERKLADEKAKNRMQEANDRQRIAAMAEKTNAASLAAANKVTEDARKAAERLFRSQTSEALQIGRMGTGLTPEQLAGSGAASRWVPGVSAIKAAEQPAVTFSNTLKKSLDEAYNRIGDLRVNAQKSAAEISAAFLTNKIDLKGLSRAELDQVTAALRRYNLELKNGGVVAKETSAFTNLLGASFGRMAARLTEFYSIRTVLFAVSDQMRTSVTTLIDLNQSLHDTLAVTGAAPKNFQAMEQAALSMAKNTKFSAVEVADAMKVLAQAGVGGSDLIPVTRVATMLATGTGATIEQASKVLTTGMNVWKIKAEDSIGIANVLTGALNASKLEIGELGTAFNYLANQSALTGRSITETTALIAMMRNQGIAASTIGTSMSQMMKTLEAPTPRFQKLLDAYKINPEDIRPTKNSMVEIIQVFEEAAKKVGNKSVAVGDIFAALETRVGRNFATLVQGGSEALRQMQDQIRNTNAAAVAWAESMKGARSQLNILKSELTETLSAYVKNFSAMLGAKDVLRDFIAGMRDAGVQAAVLTTALAGLLVTMRALVVAHPILTLFTAIGIGISILAAKLGGSNREIAASFDKLNNSMAGAARDFKNTTEELQGLNKELALNKKDAEGRVQVSEQYKTILTTVLSKYKDHADILKDERKLQAAVTEELAKQNAERREGARLELAKHNLTAGKLHESVLKYRDDYKKTFNEDLPEGATPSQMKEALDRQRASGGGFMHRSGIQSLKIFSLGRDLDTITENMAAADQAAMLQKGNVGTFVAKNSTTGVPFANYSASLENAVNTAAANDDKRLLGGKPKGGGAGTPDEYKSVDFEKLNRDLINGTAKAAADVRVKVLESEIKQTEENMKFASDGAAASEFKEEDNKLTSQLDSWVDAKRKEIRDKLWADVLGSAQGEYTPADDANPFGTYRFADKRRQDDFEKNKNTLDANITNRVVTEVPGFDAKASLMGTKRPEYNPPVHNAGSPKLTAPQLEKQLSLELQAAQQAINLRKEEASTAQEILGLDQKSLNTTIDIGRRKVSNLQQDNKLIEEWKAGPGLLEKNKEELERLTKVHDENIERIKTENLLLEEQRAKLSRLSDESFWGNFKRGFEQAGVALGTFKSNFESFGNQIGGTLFSGTENLIGSTLDSFTKPESEETKKLRRDINELKGKKAELESTIASASAGGVSTPEQAAALGNLKIQLRDVNAQLKEQGDQLDRQTNAWTRFKDSLSKLVQQIADEIQRFIVRLMVLYAWQKLTGLALNSAGGIPATETITDSNGVTNTISTGLVAQAATGGFVTNSGIQRFASGGLVLNGVNGGQIPTNMGKRGVDSVPVITTPGEFIVRESAVAHYGLDFFRQVNAQRFAEGGLVGAADSYKGTAKSSGGDGDANLTIINVVDPKTIPKTSGQEILNVISFATHANDPVIRQLKAKIMDR